MKTVIDWSKAPDGATHYMPKQGAYSEVWVKNLTKDCYDFIPVGIVSIYWENSGSIIRHELDGLITRPEVKPVTVPTKPTVMADNISCPVCYIGHHHTLTICSNCGNDLQEKTPIFTQAMADAGVLPSVGMECLAKRLHESDHCFQRCFIIGKDRTGHYLVFEYGDILEQTNIDNGTFEFKPLTPPIELIDGKAYLVTHKGNGHRYEALYQKSTDTFFSSSNNHPSKFFTNIQLLEVTK